MQRSLTSVWGWRLPRWRWGGKGSPEFGGLPSSATAPLARRHAALPSCTGAARSLPPTTPAALVPSFSTETAPAPGGGSSPSARGSNSAGGSTSEPGNGRGTSRGNKSWKSNMAWEGMVAMAGISSGVVLYLSADAARSFERRRLDAVKRKLLETLDPAKRPQLGVGELQGVFARPAAMSAVAPVLKAGLHMVYGPEGEGTSMLMRLLEAEHPCVIRANLQQQDMDTAVRTMAAAVGYDLELSLLESMARAAGFVLPDFAGAQGESLFLHLLNVFDAACCELREDLKQKDAMVGRAPALVLDHANCRLKAENGSAASLAYAAVERGHCFANDTKAMSLVLVTSDPSQEDAAWTKAGGHDSLRKTRAPALTADEADTLLARIIYRQLHPKAGEPSAEDLEAVKGAYASTLEFAHLAMGPRARCLVDFMGGSDSTPPLSDAQLAAAPEGAFVTTPKDEQEDPYLPSNLYARRLDPALSQRFRAVVHTRCEELDKLVDVPADFARVLRDPMLPTEEDRLAQRVLAVDTALRYILAAPAGEALPAHLIAVRFFAGHREQLAALYAAHVLFYDIGSATLELESPLMRRVVAALLASPLHTSRVELLRTVQAWQAATIALEKAEAAAILPQRCLAAAGIGELASRRAHVQQLEAKITALRARVATLSRERQASEVANEHTAGSTSS